MPAAPADYDVEVGDEMFMGQQAVLAEVRARLAKHPDIALAACAVVDDYMREMIAQEREDDDEDDEGGHECRNHADAAECDEFCNPHWCVRPSGQGDVPTPEEEGSPDE